MVEYALGMSADSEIITVGAGIYCGMAVVHGKCLVSDRLETVPPAFIERGCHCHSYPSGKVRLEDEQGHGPVIR